MCGVPPRLAYGLRSSAFVVTWNVCAARPAIRDRVRRLLDAQATSEKAGSVERVPPAESDSRSVCEACVQRLRRLQGVERGHRERFLLRFPTLNTSPPPHRPATFTPGLPSVCPCIAVLGPVGLVFTSSPQLVAPRQGWTPAPSAALCRECNTSGTMSRKLANNIIKKML